MKVCFVCLRIRCFPLLPYFNFNVILCDSFLGASLFAVQQVDVLAEKI